MAKNSNKKYNVIIVGAGPSGIFAAIELTLKNKCSVLLIEKGKDLYKRARDISSINSGWGGAGAFSDGKLTLSTETGGWLRQYINEKELSELINYVDSIYLKFGAPKKEYGEKSDKIDGLKRKAVLADLTLIPSKIRHLGTENCFKVLTKMRQYLDGKIDINTNANVEELIIDKKTVKGIKASDGRLIYGDCVIVAPGREGTDWLISEAKRLKLSITANQVDIGVRVELPAPIMEELSKALFEAKLIYNSKRFEDQVRTFCMCPYGHVTKESYGDVVTVNGHSYANKKTNNTNFALLVSTTFTEPFKEPISYGKYIARLANLLSEGIIIQRLGDLQMGRRSTWERVNRSTVKPTLLDCTPGDLSFVLPYRHLSNIIEMIYALDKLSPGVASGNTLLYGIEVKFYSSRIALNNSLETEINNLYAIGDGAGITRGLVQASASGVIAARSILKKIKKEG